MRFLIIIIGLTTSIGFSRAQTGPEKVAAELCKCSKQFDYPKYITIINSNDKATIRNNFEEMSEIISQTKVCARNNVKLTAQEGQRVPETEIAAALKANCPEVDELYVKFRAVRIQFEKEEEKKEIDARFNVIDGFVIAKQKDSVAFYINDFIYYYGRSDEFILDLIERYYQVGDLENGNSEAEILIEGMSYEGYIYDAREDKTIPMKEHVKTKIIALAKKYKQQTIVDFANSKL
jgi:hypothetical protein